MSVDVGWVLTDEILLIVGKPVHRIAGADTASACIVKDAHDRGGEVCARNRVP